MRVANKEPAWRTTIHKADGFAGMSDAEVTAWARGEADRVARAAVDAFITRSVYDDAWAIATMTPRDLRVTIPRIYQGPARGWRIDRSAPFMVEAFDPVIRHFVILDHQTDAAPDVFHPIMFVRRANRGS